MSDVTPKMKTFIFISMICLLINLGASLFKTPFDIASVFASIPTSFLPFFDLISLFFLNLPTEITAFLTVVLGLLGALKLYYLIVIVANFLPFVDV